MSEEEKQEVHDFTSFVSQIEVTAEVGVEGEEFICSDDLVTVQRGLGDFI